jgi:metal-responsive CopG/Arc/MetJ family transcriptional regulator
MKTAISIPDPVFDQADCLAKRLQISRSALYTRAVEGYIDEHRRSRVREKLDKLYSTEPSGIDPATLKAQAASIPREEW